MTRQGVFLIYCVETYKNAKHLTGKQVAELFTRYRVWDYVYSCFEALHTTGANYTCCSPNVSHCHVFRYRSTTESLVGNSTGVQI